MLNKFLITALAIAATTAMPATMVQSAMAAAPAAPKVAKIIPAPPAGKGQIVFYRSGGSGMMLGCGVNTQGERISALGAGRYFILPVEPGALSYTVKSEATDSLTLEVGPDETAYVKCSIKMGIVVGRPDLALGSKDDFDQRSPKLKYVDADDVGPLVLANPASLIPTLAVTTTEAADTTE
jgi:hypothetical protein